MEKQIFIKKRKIFTTKRAKDMETSKKKRSKFWHEQKMSCK